MNVEDYVLRFSADTGPLKRDLSEVQRVAQGFTSGLTRAFDRLIFQGASFGDVLRSLALNLSSRAFDAALSPLEKGLQAGISNLFGAVLPFRQGGVVGPNGVSAFAKGGIVNGPTLFSAGRSGLGLMGEAGPEAILPLKRGPDGRLGVGTGGGGAPVTVNVSIQTPDVDGFRRARGQVAADLARAVDRGRRHL